MPKTYYKIPEFGAFVEEFSRLVPDDPILKDYKFNRTRSRLFGLKETDYHIDAHWVMTKDGKISARLYTNEAYIFDPKLQEILHNLSFQYENRFQTEEQPLEVFLYCRYCKPKK